MTAEQVKSLFRQRGSLSPAGLKKTATAAMRSTVFLMASPKLVTANHTKLQ